MAAYRCPARVDKPEDMTFERAVATCRFQGGVTTGILTVLSKDLATSTKAIFDHVHAKFGTEDIMVITAVVQDAMPNEVRGMRFAT